MVTDRRFLEVGSALVALGVPPSEVLDEWEHLLATVDELAGRFIDLFERHVVDGLGDRSLDAVGAVLDQLAVLARTVVVAALDTVLRRHADEYAGRSLGR